MEVLKKKNKKTTNQPQNLKGEKMVWSTRKVYYVKSEITKILNFELFIKHQNYMKQNI